MSNSQPTLTIPDISSRFSALLEAEGTTLEAPDLSATWKAFAKFCSEPVECDDERLFFEADLSGKKADSFYVHFVRTFYGREPVGHLWSHELICDFVFSLEDSLEAFNVIIEAEDLCEDSDARDQFLAEVQSHRGLWLSLAGLKPIETQIYVGES